MSETVSSFGFDLQLGRLLSELLTPTVESPRTGPDADTVREQVACGEPPAPNFSTRDPFDVLRERGISEEVQAARGYIPYYGKKHPKHDHEKGSTATADADAFLRHGTPMGDAGARTFKVTGLAASDVLKPQWKTSVGTMTKRWMSMSVRPITVT